MGPQSQFRNSLKQRTYLLAANSNYNAGKRKAGDQQTLGGGVAFDPWKDCKVCVGKLQGREVKRAHHPLCWNNTRTKGRDPKEVAKDKADKERIAQINTPPVQDTPTGATAEPAQFFTPNPRTRVRKKSKKKGRAKCGSPIQWRVPWLCVWLLLQGSD